MGQERSSRLNHTRKTYGVSNDYSKVCAISLSILPANLYFVSVI